MRKKLLISLGVLNLINNQALAENKLQKFIQGEPVILDQQLANELNLNLAEIKVEFTNNTTKRDFENEPIKIQYNKEADLVDITSFDNITIRIPIERAASGQPNVDI